MPKAPIPLSAKDTFKSFKACINADLFARAMVGCSRDQSRYYLNGVHVSPHPKGGAILSATDGHILIVIRDPEAYCVGERIVSLQKNMAAALRSVSPSGWPCLGPVLLLEENDARESAGMVAHPDDSLVRGKLPDRPENEPIYKRMLPLLDKIDGRVVAYQGKHLLIDGRFPDIGRVVNVEYAGDARPFSVGKIVIDKLYKALCHGGVKNAGNLTFHTVKHSPDRKLVPGEYAGQEHGVMAIPSSLNGTPFEAFAIAMPMRENITKAPPLWFKEWKDGR